jgi:NAD-dependent dihydropyrimidine dehydrogenase PreA subunit
MKSSSTFNDHKYNARIEMDLEACSKCKICMQSCFIDVIRWDNNENKPIIAYMEDCVACLSCEVNCPRQCIKVTPIFPMTVLNSV